MYWCKLSHAVVCLTQDCLEANTHHFEHLLQLWMPNITCINGVQINPASEIFMRMFIFLVHEYITFAHQVCSYYKFLPHKLIMWLLTGILRLEDLHCGLTAAHWVLAVLPCWWSFCPSQKNSAQGFTKQNKVWKPDGGGKEKEGERNITGPLPHVYLCNFAQFV